MPSVAEDASLSRREFFGWMVLILGLRVLCWAGLNGCGDLTYLGILDRLHRDGAMSILASIKER